MRLEMKKVKFLKYGRIIIIFQMIFFSSGLYSQSKQKIKKLSEYMAERREITEKQKREIIPLEDFIDMSNYYIGPGDVFYVNLWGEVEKSFTVQVLPEGKILIPTIGVINLKGLNLKEAKNLIEKYIINSYPNSVVTVSLADIRKFKVYIEGEVNNPGSYIVNPAIRISDLIETAGGVTEWADKQKIVIKSNSGTEKIFDLLTFENEGKKELNPFLRDGDFVFVPRIKFSEGVIKVSGDSEISGFYKFYEGETLSDFLKRIKVRKTSTDWERAYLKRQNPDVILPFCVMDDSARFKENIKLKNKDFLYLPPLINKVYVIGAVALPGSYDFLPDMKAKDYIGMAGKTSDGSNDVKVRKRKTGKVVKGLDVDIDRGDIVIVPRKWHLKVRDFLQSLIPITSILIAAKAIGVIK